MDMTQKHTPSAPSEPPVAQPIPQRSTPPLWNPWLSLATIGGNFERAKTTVAEWLEKNAATPEETALRELLSGPRDKADEVAFVKGLIDCGANAAARRGNETTALMNAAHRGNTLLVELFLSHGKLGAKDGSGRQALRIAAEAGHAECVKLLLPHSDARAEDARGQTALEAATVNGHAECVALLLPASDARRVSETGGTVLMQATLRGRAECIELLLPHSDVQAKDNRGVNALLCAASQRGAVGCVPRLLPGSDAKAADNKGWTPLMRAAAHATPEGLAALRALAPLSDVEARNNRGANALDVALGQNCLENADLLMGFANFERVAEIFAGLQDWQREQMPATCARMEREELAQTIKETGNVGPKTVSEARKVAPRL